MSADTERKHHPDTEAWLTGLRARLREERITWQVLQTAGYGLNPACLINEAARRRASFFDSLHSWPEVGRP